MKTIIATMTAALMSFAAAENAFAAEVSHSVFRGDSIIARFNQDLPITCDDTSTAFFSTFVAVNAFANVSHLKGTKDNSTAAAATVSTFNGCTGVFTLGIGVIDNPDYGQQNVNSADLTGTFTVVDGFGSGLVSTVVVDLTWTGVGPVNRNHTNDRFQSGPVVFNFEQTGVSRQATLSGTVTVNGVDFLPFTQNAVLENSKSGTLLVQRN